MLLKARAAKYGPPLRWFKGDSSLDTAFGTGSPSFDAISGISARALNFALFAMLRGILELLFTEE